MQLNLDFQNQSLWYPARAVPYMLKKCILNTKTGKKLYKPILNLNILSVPIKTNLKGGSILFKLPVY